MQKDEIQSKKKIHKSQESQPLINDNEQSPQYTNDVIVIPNNTTNPCTNQRPSGLRARIDDYFEITKRDSTFTKEIRGGLVGFLTLAYIILLNPQVLAVSNIPYRFAASATCLASCISTLICGIYGNIPVGCGPGVGLSAYFSYGMMPAILNEDPNADSPYLSGLLMAFLSGAVVFILTVPGVVTMIVNSLPHFLKISTIVGMGLFLAFVGMVDVSLVEKARGQGNAVLTLGNVADPIVTLALFNLLLIATLKYFKIKGSLLICIVVTTVIYFVTSQQYPHSFVDLPTFQNPILIFYEFGNLPLQVTVESIISFVLILFLDVSGVTFAIAKLCGLDGDKELLSSFQKSAFIGTSIGTMIAAPLGCSPIIVCIETSSGAASGARTGLSAIVIAFFFFVAMFLGPVLGDVPPAATSPVLIFIGTLMMAEVGQIEWGNMRIAIPAFMCISMMPFTYSISNGLFFGLGFYLLTYISTGQWLTKSACTGITSIDAIMDDKDNKNIQKKEIVDTNETEIGHKIANSQIIKENDNNNKIEEKKDSKCESFSNEIGINSSA